MAIITNEQYEEAIDNGSFNLDIKPRPKRNKGRRRGTPSKSDYWRSENGQMYIIGWKRNGLTDEQVAHNMGIAPSTLSEWKAKFDEIAEALNNGQDITNFFVENALIQNAMNGNVTAQMFYLANRYKDKYSRTDKQEVNVSVENLSPLANMLGLTEEEINQEEVEEDGN